MEEDREERLRTIVRDITEDAIPLPRWAIGDIVEHPEGYPVEIQGGCLWEVYPDGGQRLVNRWSWRRVDGRGNPIGPVIVGSGWAADPSVSGPSFGH